MDFEKEFLGEIILTSEDYFWVQKLDYENPLFWCQACYETSHQPKYWPKATQHSSKIDNYIVFKNKIPMAFLNVVESNIDGEEQGS